MGGPAGSSVSGRRGGATPPIDGKMAAELRAGKDFVQPGGWISIDAGDVHDHAALVPRHLAREPAGRDGYSAEHPRKE